MGIFGTGNWFCQSCRLVKRFQKNSEEANERKRSKREGEREKIPILNSRGDIFGIDRTGEKETCTTQGKVLLEDPPKLTSWLITKTSQKIRFNSWLLDLVVVDSSISMRLIMSDVSFQPKKQHERHHENGMKSNVETRRLLKCENASKLWHLISTRVDGPRLGK